MNKIQILMSTYNGESFLAEQIDSLLAQEDVTIDILVRDDGSTDQTKSILEDYQKRGLLIWYDGENLKPAKSFMNLLSKAEGADYYAFCDQDDFWETNKLKKAIDFLSLTCETKPALYLSNTNLVDSDLSPIFSPRIKTLLTFGESLIRNSATGCTVVFNNQLLNSLKKFTPSFLLMHDSWVYQVCLALGGCVYFDEESFIKYRQHGNNVVGGNESFISKLKKRCKIYLGNNGGERFLNAEQLYIGYSDQMIESNRVLLLDLLNYKKSFRNKIKIISSLKYKTANKESNIGFVFSLLLNKY